MNFSNSSIVSGSLIPSDKSITNIEAYNKKSAETMQLYFWHDEPLKLEIVYTSIYGEKWITRGGFTRPKKIKD